MMMKTPPTEAPLMKAGQTTTSRIRGTVAVVVSALSAVIIAGCATGPKEPPLTDEQRRLNVESFEYVWTTIRDRHWDPELGGLDWQAAHDELQPLVEQARTMSQARGPFNDLIERLGKSHFGIIPADLYEDLLQPAGEGDRDGVTGIDVRVIDGRALAVSVEEDSPAAELGVHPGWEVRRIGEADIPSKLEKIGLEFEGKTTKDLRLARAVGSRLRGRIGDTISVLFGDGGDRPVELQIPLVEPTGRKVNFGNLPAMYVSMEWELREDNIGCVALSSFFDPGHVMGAFNDAMKAFMNADGVIIDLRGNPGGLGAMSMGMAGWFVHEKGQRLGTMFTRNNELKFFVSPRAVTYDGPLAFLVDGLSASTSEIFVGGLQDLGRARVFGSRTAGAALPSTIEKLANGDGFQYAIGNYLSESGEVLEGVGVTPDVEVIPRRDELLQGRDPSLEAALAWIREQG